MQKDSEKDFIDILGMYNVPLEQFKADEWKNIVISHAQGTVVLFLVLVNTCTFLFNSIIIIIVTFFMCAMYQ